MLEELNLRRNRIRSTQGLEMVPSLQKLYMSNNDIQGLGSLVNLDSLTKLQTIQMEGNPVWSSPDYSYHLISSLPSLVTLDQQDVSQDAKASAKRWKDSKLVVQSQRQPSPNYDNQSLDKSKALLYKKLEERNASISNAKHRWNFLKTKTLVNSDDFDGADEGVNTDHENQDIFVPSIKCSTEIRSANNTTVTISTDNSDNVKNDTLSNSTKDTPVVTTDSDVFNKDNQTRLDVPEKSFDFSPNVDRSKGAIPKIIRRQASEKSLVKPSVNVTPPGNNPPLHLQRRPTGTHDHPSETLTTSTRKISAPATTHMPPPLPIKDSAIRIKFPGLERRKFALPQRYETLNDSDDNHKALTRSNSLQDLSDKQKIGFFTIVPKKVGQQQPGDRESSSTGK